MWLSRQRKIPVSAAETGGQAALKALGNIQLNFITDLFDGGGSGSIQPQGFCHVGDLCPADQCIHLTAKGCAQKNAVAAS